MKRINKAQRNYMIMGLCAILIIMAAGYAAFASQLRISGTSNIGSNFLVKITNIVVSEKIGNASDKTDITTYNDTSATFGVSLVSPGDSITYDITIANQGTMDAVLKLITKTDTNNSAILFETNGVNEGDELKAGQTATMKVKVTYNPSVTSQPDNLESNLTLTLDYEQTGGSVTPLITTEFGGQEVEVVSSGDGLYEDEYESGKYTYKGATPNNYITFNNETWRIISVESDGAIKIMRNETVSTVYDTNDSTIGRNNANNTYCQVNTSMGHYYGCNAWGAVEGTFVNGSKSGTVKQNSTAKTYLNETYLPTITVNKNKIISRTWSMGGITRGNSDLATQIANENGVQSQSASVGMITASEYLRANSNKEQCENISVHDTNFKTCNTTNWIKPLTNGTFTLTPAVDTYNNVISVGFDDVGIGAGFPEATVNIFPVIYLTPSTLLSGTGSSTDPYIITN